MKKKLFVATTISPNYFPQKISTTKLVLFGSTIIIPNQLIEIIEK